MWVRSYVRWRAVHCGVLAGALWVATMWLHMAMWAECGDVVPHIMAAVGDVGPLLACALACHTAQSVLAGALSFATVVSHVVVVVVVVVPRISRLNLKSRTIV